MLARCTVKMQNHTFQNIENSKMSKIKKSKIENLARQILFMLFSVDSYALKPCHAKFRSKCVMDS